MYVLYKDISSSYNYECYNGCDGKGHTMSFALSGQNSCILLYKYHCHSSGSPGGLINVGTVPFDGFHDTSLKMLIIFSGTSLPVLTNMTPGALLDIQK